MESRCSLITGAAGFIGSHLAEHLASRGDRLILIDDLSTGNIDNLKSLSVFQTPLPAQTQALSTDPIVWREGKASDVLAAEPELLNSVDVIYHLAAAVGVKLIVEHPVEAIRTNIDETTAVLDAAANARPGGIPVLLASSSEVYGKTTQVPMREDQDLVSGPTTSPRWSYALSKALDEHIALAYHRERRTPVVIARLFNTIGPRQIGHYGMVVPRFVRSAVAGQPLLVYGDGTQTRCFCDVRNVVEGLTAMLSPSPHAPSAPSPHLGEIFNLGSDREITILQLAQTVIKLAESASPINLVPFDQAYHPGFTDLARRIPDTKKSSINLGFSATIELHETLEELIQLERSAAAPHAPHPNQSSRQVSRSR